MWRAILTQTQKFIQLIQETPVTIEEWYNQKKSIQLKIPNTL